MPSTQAKQYLSTFQPAPFSLQFATLILTMRKRKLLDRLKNNPNGATFDDIRTLLLREGFQLDRTTGSHHIFRKSGTIFVIPVHANRVKSVYVKRVIELVEQTKGTTDEA